jgi:hypothetical protein
VESARGDRLYSSVWIALHYGSGIFGVIGSSDLVYSIYTPMAFLSIDTHYSSDKT